VQATLWAQGALRAIILFNFVQAITSDGATSELSELGMQSCQQGELTFNGSLGSFVTSSAMTGERNGFYFTGRFKSFADTGLLLYQRGDAVRENPNEGDAAFLTLEVIGGRLRASRGCGDVSTAYAHAAALVNDGEVHTFRLEESSTLGLRLQLDSTSFVSADYSSKTRLSCTGIM
jgi:hypothetical protein